MITHHISEHIRQVYEGGNWSDSCFKSLVFNVNYKEATQYVNEMNSIYKLCFHINYYCEAINRVMRGEALNAHDQFSFDAPELTDEVAWNKFTEHCLKQGKELAMHCRQLEDKLLLQTFIEEKYGTWFRNLSGFLEHTHYHLGQIALLKKLIRIK